MKHLLLICATLVLFCGCNKDDNNGQLDRDAMVSIRPAAGVKAVENQNHLSALEIVKQTSGIEFYSQKYSVYTGRGFAAHQRDTVNNRLLMYGSDIIDNGELITGFISAKDIVFVRFDRATDKIIDTIAYIPNSVIRTAEKAITEAHSVGDYKTCYRLFDEAFTFIPITGSEWKELQSKERIKSIP